MTTTTLKPAKGNLLISVPFLNDQFFGRSVVLLTEHNEEGSVGLILNKVLDTRIHEAISDFPEFDAPLHLGGPVSANSLFYLHVLGDMIPGSVEIISGLFWGGDFDHLRTLITLKEIKTDDIKFFVGYSGWGENQLDREMKENSWLVQKASVKSIMSSEQSDYWKYLIKKTNREYAVWADFPVNPSLN